MLPTFSSGGDGVYCYHKKGRFVPDSLSKAILYNQPLLEKHYPNMDRVSMQRFIEAKVDEEIQSYLKDSGDRAEKG